MTTSKTSTSKTSTTTTDASQQHSNPSEQPSNASKQRSNTSQQHSNASQQTSKPSQPDTPEQEQSSSCTCSTSTTTVKVSVASSSNRTPNNHPSSERTQSDIKTSITSTSKHHRRQKSCQNLQKYQQHILQLTNAVRASVNSPPVTLNNQLNDTARLHNTDVALVQKELSHVSSDGRTLTERLLGQCYDFRYASENLARGQRNCQWVINSWMKSPGHRRNLVNPRVRDMGLHVGQANGRMYWCQVFGVRRGAE